MKKILYIVVCLLVLVNCTNQSAQDGATTDTCAVAVVDTVVPVYQQVEAIDLGLSVLWADRNLGASEPADCGCYYPSLKAQDTINALLGNGWRLPTVKEMEELFHNTDWWGGALVDAAGVRIQGRQFISKRNGIDIFLPSAGFMRGSLNIDYSTYGVYPTSTHTFNGQYNKGMWGGRNDNGRDIFNNISFPRHAGYPDPDGYDRSSERVSVSQGSVPDVWKDRDENGNIIYHGYDYATNWIGWGCYFNVYASIYYGNVNLTSKVPVFSFPGYNQWGGPPDVDDAISGYPFVGITKPITLQSPEPVSESILLREENRMKGYEHLSDEEYKLQVVDSIIKRERKLSSGRTDRVVPVTLVIYNNSQCSCDQTNKNRPVFAADITQYIPDKKGYVWRRFGSSATEDPEGSAIAERMGKEESELLDGEWHLVRPFFYKSGSEWVDVEKDVEL